MEGLLAQYRGDTLKKTHSNLYNARQEEGWKDEDLAAAEHYAFARALVDSNPLWALPLSIATPAYYAAKKLDMYPDATPASLKQMNSGFKGIFDALFQ